MSGNGLLLCPSQPLSSAFEMDILGLLTTIGSVFFFYNRMTKNFVKLFFLLPPSK